MRAKTAILLLALLLTTAVAVAGAGGAFAQANRFYGQGRYGEALALYRKAAAQSGDWRLAYNMGNCHYKLGDYLQAKVLYLKARRLRPLEPALARNLALVDRHFQDDARLPAPGFLARALQALESWVSLDALSIMLLLAALLFNVLFFRLLTRGRNRRLLYALGFSLLLLAGLGACHAGRTAAAARSVTAVVADEETALRSGPGADNTVLFKVHRGLEVRIIDRSGPWLQVAASASVAGWIEAARLILI